jgi:hypothetical protein
VATSKVVYAFEGRAGAGLSEEGDLHHQLLLVLPPARGLAHDPVLTTLGSDPKTTEQVIRPVQRNLRFWSG